MAADDWMKVLRFMVSGSFQVNSRVSTRRLRPLLATRFKILAGRIAPAGILFLLLLDGIGLIVQVIEPGDEGITFLVRVRQGFMLE